MTYSVQCPVCYAERDFETRREVDEQYREQQRRLRGAKRPRRAPVDWYEVLIDALCDSDGGNNPFYRDDSDTVALAQELAEVVRERLR